MSGSARAEGPLAIAKTGSLGCVTPYLGHREATNFEPFSSASGQKFPWQFKLIKTFSLQSYYGYTVPRALLACSPSIPFLIPRHNVGYRQPRHRRPSVFG